MKNSFHRRACLLLLAAALLLAGCFPAKNVLYTSTPSERSSNEIHLTFFGYKYEPLNVLAIEKALHDYMAEHPQTTIAYESIKGRDYYAALTKRLASGNGDDIFMVDQATLLSLDKPHQLADLSDLSTLPAFNALVKSQMYADDGKL